MIQVLFFCCALTGAMAQRDTIFLDTDWQFATDQNEKGFTEKWYEHSLPQAQQVKLPHTWNIAAGTEMYYGQAWYQRKIFIPASWKHKNLVLQFGAVNHTSFIYINDQLAGENIGDGFDKFFVNITSRVQFGKENVITVAVNNAYGRNKVPFGSSFDWPNDGGIIRPVALIVSGNPSANYIHADAVLHPADSSGNLTIRLGYDNVIPAQTFFSVQVQEENQSTHNIIYSSTVQPVWNEKREAVLSLDLPNVHPWHFDFPNLYRITVQVIQHKQTIDQISTHVGFREIKWKEGRFYLNGEPVKLMGVEWTAGSNPDMGFAEPDTAIIRMGKLMKAVNCIFTREHFQQSDVFYDFCDRNGILVQQELPLWGPETPANDTIQRIATQQLTAMIRNLYNHPSIFSWGVGNELRGRDADMKKMIAYLIRQARVLDPSRQVAYVSNTLTNSFYNDPQFVPDAASEGDYLMMNEYGGSWWDLPVGEIGNYLDSVHLSYPSHPFIISEFGLCEPNFRGGDERRTQDLIYHMSLYESKPYISGAIYFDLTDYRTHYPGTNENNKYRRRIHGIYDMYGNPKPSMKVLRELSAPVEVQQMRQWEKGKVNLLIIGSMGLPQFIMRGYKLYVSDRTDNYTNYPAYSLPVLHPGERINVDVKDLFQGEGIVTVVNPLGYIVSQKSFYKTLD